MRKILQDNINARNHGNFGSLPANARELALAVQRVIEQFIVFRNNHLWWHIVKHQLSLTSIEEKKEVDPGTLPQTNGALCGQVA